MFSGIHADDVMYSGVGSTLCYVKLKVDLFYRRITLFSSMWPVHYVCSIVFLRRTLCKIAYEVKSLYFLETLKSKLQFYNKLDLYCVLCKNP